MARFHKVPAVYSNMEDAEKNKLMGLDNLPVETGVTDIYIDLDRVESFAESIKDDEDCTEIIMYSGLHSLIAMDINSFLKLITNEM